MQARQNELADRPFIKFTPSGNPSGYGEMKLFSVRRNAVLLLISLLLLAACKSDQSIDRIAAKGMSDAFLTYLAANRVGDAVGEMEPELLQGSSRDQTESEIRKLFDYCGRPLDSEFKHDEIGMRVYLKGVRSQCESSTTQPTPRNIEKECVTLQLRWCQIRTI
jgi:hypothetical protein